MSKFFNRIKSVLGLTKDLGSVMPETTLIEKKVVSNVCSNTFRPSNYRKRIKRKRKMQQLSRRRNRC